MPKEIHKVIMKRSRLRNIFLKHTTDTNKKTTATKDNFYQKLLRNTKKSYFENLVAKKITDNKSFWRVSYHFLPKSHQKVKNVTSSMIIKSSDEELCETFNQFFSNVVPTLNIPNHTKSLF